MAKFKNAKIVSAVINFPTDKEKDAFGTNAPSLDLLGRYYSILHTRDTDSEGVLKTPHAHIVIFGEEGRGTNGWIDTLSMAFKVPANCVSVESTRNPTGSIRYLMHLDDEDKADYSIDEVITNDAKGLNEAYNATPKRTLDSFTKGEFLDCRTASDLFDLVGGNLYQRARVIWKDLVNDAIDARKVGAQYDALIKNKADAFKALARIIDNEPMTETLRLQLAEVQRILTLGVDWANEKFEQENGVTITKGKDE